MQSKTLFILSCFIAFINLFFFRSIGFFGLHLFFVGAWVLICALAFTKNNFQKYLPVYLGTGICLFLSTILGTNRSNEVVHFVLAMNSLFLVSLTVYTLVSIYPHLYSLIEVIIHPWLNLMTYLSAVSHILDNTNKNKLAAASVEKTSVPKTEENTQWKKIRPIAGGFLLAAPIAFFLISLFSQADPVFGSLVKNLVGQTFLENMIWRAFLSGICFALGVPLLFMQRKQPFVSPLNRLDKLSLVIEYSVVMSVIAVVIGAFLLVQWQYIFIPSVSGVNLSQFGVATYSEYVNKGFNELLIATLFIFGLIWFGLLLIRRKPANQVRFLKSVQFVVLMEFVVVVLSVFRRIWLYQHYHGMSLIRFYGGYFLLFLLAMTATLFLRHIFNYRFVLIEIGIVAVSIFGLAFINVEGYIADSHPPTVNDRVDYVYLSRMSADGEQGWKKSFSWTQQVLDTPYPDANTISAEQRRQIAYAGVTLEQLLSRYHELAIAAGNDQELKQYYQVVLNNLLKENEASWNQLDNLQKQIVTQQDNQEALKTLGRYREDLTREKEKLQRTIQAVEKNEFSRIPALLDPNTPVASWADRHSNGKVNFDPTLCGFWSMCGTSLYGNLQNPNTFYSVTEQTQQERKYKTTMLDQIFTWNPKKRVVFQDLQATMPLEELLRLQGKYFILAHRISSQPQNERDYDADISLNTPFLKPVSTLRW